MDRVPLNQTSLLARLSCFDPAAGIPLTILTATAADALPQRSRREDIAMVQALLDDLEVQGLIVRDEDEPIVYLAPAGQAAAAALPEALRSTAANPVEQVMSDWYALNEAGTIGDPSATTQRLLAHIAQVARLAAARGDQRIVLGMRMYHGQLALPLGDIDAAAEDSACALAAAEQMSEHRDLALMAAHDLAGRVALYRGDATAAEQHARAAITHLPPERRAEALVERTAKLASTLVEQGRYGEVVTLIAPLLPQLDTGVLVPPLLDLAYLLRCYGSSLIAVGRQQEGLATLQEAVNLLEDEGDAAEVVGALDDLALGQAMAGQLDPAVATFEQMLQRAQRAEIFGPQLVQHLNNFAGALRSAGDLARAQTLLRRAQAVAHLTRADPDLVAMIAHNMADLEAQLAAAQPGTVCLVADHAPTLLQPFRTVVTVLVDGEWTMIDDALTQLHRYDTTTDVIMQLDRSMVLAAEAATTRAIRAIHAHLLAHQEVYDQLGVSLFALPRPLAEGGDAGDHAIFSEQTLRDKGDISFAEEVRAAALRGVLVRMQDELASRQGLPGDVLAPTDAFFSAVDGSPTISAATWAALEAEPAPFMLVAIDLLTLPYPVPNRAEVLAADLGDEDEWDEEEWDEDDDL